MALASSASKVHMTVRTKEIIVKVVASGNYVNNGDTLNLTLMTNPNFITNASFGFPGDISDYEVLTSPPGFVGNLIPGTNLTNWLLEVFQTGAAVNSPLAQIPAGAYPAGVTGSFFLLRFRGPKLRL